MRKLLLFTLAMIFTLAGFSQRSSLYYDDFEGYTVGSFIAVDNPTWWTTWSNLPGSAEDGEISNIFASSPVNSVLIDKVPAESDLILKLGDKTSGAYELSWDMYVETGYAGYYNIQHYESPGIQWASEVYFLANGSGELLAGSSTPITFTYPKDTWFQVLNKIDIDADVTELYIDGVLVHTWPFHYQASGTTGASQLGGVDFFAGAKTGEVPRYYFDNVDFKPMPITLYADDFEAYNVNEFIAVVNPTWWTTWSNLPGSGEDGEIVEDYANSPTKSVVIDEVGGASDLILKLGDRISGSYDLNWMMYVESGYAGYYNVQHYQSPGIQWAYEIYFLADGTGELYAGSTTPFTFDYPQGNWFMVDNIINIDSDTVTLVINDIEVLTWPFHYQADGTTGANQLGGVDFYAGAATGETPKYYFDDVNFLQLIGASDPIIAIDPASITATAPVGSLAEEILNITNNGSADLAYQISVIYPMPVTKAAGNSLAGQAAPVRSLGYTGEVSADPNARPASYNPPPADDFVLHYDGDNFSAIGWSSVPITPIVAAMFPTNLTLPHAGMMISSVDVYINDPGTDFVLKIYDMGTSYQPGTLLVSQPFTGQSLSWNTITLDNPVYITGADVWVGYQFTQSLAETFIPGTDGGPANPNGDFISSGVGWSHLSNNPDLNYNWNIRANLTGTPVEQWLSAAPASGVITPGNSEAVTVTCDAIGLDIGTYMATLRIVSNDPDNPQIDVPVTFEVTEGGTVMSEILNFESQADWSLTFDPWTALDNDGSSTYGITGYDFTHSGEAMAFIAFNPATTVPPMTDAEIQPHGGARFGACMASADPTYENDDWMISPQVALGMNSSMTFWVKSYTDEYGLEKYNVLVSTTDMELESFSSISGPTYLEAPTVWTEMSFDLSAYDGQTVYIAFQCVSTDAFIFMLDDVSIDYYVGLNEQPQDVEIAIYPNPVTDHMSIESGVEMTQVDIFNQLGQKVYSHVVKDTNFKLNTSEFNAGVYFVRITTDQGIATEKVMVK